MKKNDTPTKHICSYCKKEFARESSIISHSCIYKQRDLARDSKTSRLALQVYIRFYERNIRGRARTWSDFIHSKLYNDFVKVAAYIEENNPVNRPQFIEYLVKSEIPITQWSHPKTYEKYIRDLSRNETPDAAVKRNILLMEQWAATTGNHWTEFFEKISPSQATLWIQTGRISPWLLYICSKSKLLFDRMSSEQMLLAEPHLDPKFWGARMDRHAEDVKSLREIFDEAGL